MRRTVFIFLEIIVIAAITFFYNFFLNEKNVFGGYSYIREIKSICDFLIFSLLIDIIRRASILIEARRNHQSVRVKDNFQFGVNNVAKFILGIGLIVTILRLIGIDIKALLTSLSIVAAAIAIITKEYINDFIVGLYFSFSRDIEINDYIQLDNTKGKILAIQMLKIKILNDDDDLIIIPNTKVYNSEIINYTKRDIRSLSIDFQIAINSIKSIEHLETELKNSLQNFSEYLEPASFNLKIVDMKKDYIDLKFQYTLKHLDRELQKKIRKKTVRQIFNYISEKSSQHE